MHIFYSITFYISAILCAHVTIVSLNVHTFPGNQVLTDALRARHLDLIRRWAWAARRSQWCSLKASALSSHTTMKPCLMLTKFQHADQDLPWTFECLSNLANTSKIKRQPVPFWLKKQCTSRCEVIAVSGVLRMRHLWDQHGDDAEWVGEMWERPAFIPFGRRKSI